MKELQISLSTLCFDASGQGEKSEYTYRGRYEEEGGVCRLCWQREEEGAVTETVLSFTLEAPQVISMRQVGSSEVTMRFAAGSEQTTLYRVKGAGELPLSLQTERVENTLTPAGGRLQLVYVMHVGGVRQRIFFRLTATTKAGSETE